MPTSPSRLYSVALLIETSSGYCRGLLEGIHKFAKRQNNWSIYLNEQERGADPPKWLSKWNGDGIIARVENDQIGLRLKRLKIPIVDLSAARHLPGIPWADTDDGAIAELGVEHFLDRGFRNLAFCGDPGFAWSNARRDRFRRLAADNSCTYFELQVTHRYDPQYQWNQVRNATAAWLNKLPTPCAVMACNDYQGQLILDVCRSEGIAVPEQIVVLGVDDDRLLCELCSPPLSSIIPDTQRTGFEAAELLQRMMNNLPVDTACRLVTQPLGIRLRVSTDTIAIADSEIAEALSYIRRHALNGIGVSDILKQTSISRRSLEHRFLKSVGHTPHQEIARIRMIRVKELLRETDDSIAQIASQVGFEYPEYMTAAFKKSEGITPSEYRRKNQRIE